ncbi:hypothetical protein DFJ43DRAFT_455271 [Lentinula guzmanii]|uniref:DUF6697 domain-containing protein n=1 Tax=Lentinula guzmanii TaxID=2804957 RepID=A0AA38JKH5_9AGAR|nr:hypothetical protein DFJ43DRAFT_455271 [Lentinula guzmanii]
MPPKLELKNYSLLAPSLKIFPDELEIATQQLGRVTIENGKMIIRIERLQSQLEELKGENEGLKRKLRRKLARCICGRVSDSPVSERQPKAEVVVISDDEEVDCAFEEESKQSINYMHDISLTACIDDIKRIRSISPELEIMDNGLVDSRNDSRPPSKRPRLSQASPNVSHEHLADEKDCATNKRLSQVLQTMPTYTPCKSSNLQERKANVPKTEKVSNGQQQQHVPLVKTQAIAILSSVLNVSSDVIKPSSPQQQNQIPSSNLLSSFHSPSAVRAVVDVQSNPSVETSIYDGAQSNTLHPNRAAQFAVQTDHAVDTGHTSSTQDVYMARAERIATIGMNSVPAAKFVVGVSPPSAPGGLAHLLRKNKHDNDAVVVKPIEPTINSAPSVVASAPDISAAYMHVSVSSLAAPCFPPLSPSPPLSSDCSTLDGSLSTINHEIEMKSASKQTLVPPTREQNVIPVICFHALILIVNQIPDSASKDVEQTDGTQPVTESSEQSASVLDFGTTAGPSNGVRNEDCKVSTDLHTSVARKTRTISSSQASRLSSVPTILALDPLWMEAVRDLLRNATSLDINPAPDMNFRVSRALLNKKYRINTGSFRAILQAHLNPSSTPDNPHVRSILFPFYEENPDLPAKPGDPGIILTKRTDILTIQPVTIFINYRGRNKSPSLWLYAGEYTLKKCAEMSGEQFSRQPLKTQQRWGNTILKRKRDVWALIRARVYLRKHGIPLTEENINHERDRIRKGEPGLLVVQDVIDAFIGEDERLDIIRLECVAYDRTFVEDMGTKKVATGELKIPGKVQPKRKAREKAKVNTDSVGEQRASSSSSGSGLRRSMRERKPSERLSYAEISEPEIDLCGS